jgi:hypothetical protein
MGVSQARVSKLECGDLSHTELGTLQWYVAALGGNLRIAPTSARTAWRRLDETALRCGAAGNSAQRRCFGDDFGAPLDSPG